MQTQDERSFGPRGAIPQGPRIRCIVIPQTVDQCLMAFLRPPWPTDDEMWDG